MKTKKKTKPASSRPSVRRSARTPSNVFTPMETGRPDTDEVPGIHNPQGAQGGLGPLNQEGEGERQNDQLAALEQIDPEG